MCGLETRRAKESSSWLLLLAFGSIGLSANKTDDTIIQRAADVYERVTMGQYFALKTDPEADIDVWLGAQEQQQQPRRVTHTRRLHR